MTQFAKVVFRHAANSGHRIAMLPERKLQTGMECTFQLAVAMNEAILFEVRWRAFTKGDEHLVAEGVSGTRANTGVLIHLKYEKNREDIGLFGIWRD